ncbi:hypothetical protein JCM8097_000050 [Rhodosporidiobolus ruineniae]
MSTPPTGHCCVCGKETKDRCGACGKAGFNLFFCSREHQKLVWFAHKRICASRTKPFSFPPLTEDEIEYAKDHINVSYGVQRRGSVTLATELTEMCFSFNSLLLNRPEALHVLLDDLGGDSPPSPLFTLGQRNELISQIRTVFFAIRRTLEPNSPAPTSPTFSPLSGRPAFPAAENWYIRFQHAAVVFSALRYLLLRDGRTLAATSPNGPVPSRIMKLDGFIRNAKGEFIKLGNEMRAAHPVQSAAVLQLVQKAL